MRPWLPPHLSTVGENFGTPNALTTLKEAFTISSAGIDIILDLSSAVDKPENYQFYFIESRTANQLLINPEMGNFNFN